MDACTAKRSPRLIFTTVRGGRGTSQLAARAKRSGGSGGAIRQRHARQRIAQPDERRTTSMFAIMVLEPLPPYRAVADHDVVRTLRRSDLAADLASG